jgi:hypothetical protein
VYFPLEITLSLPFLGSKYPHDFSLQKLWIGKGLNRGYSDRDREKQTDGKL